MRNLKLEANVLDFIEKNEKDYIDCENIIGEFKKTEPLLLYDALVALRKNKKIERINIGNYYYYKKL
jgi:Fe2+ or Zn2+ uptake regulation protein